MRFHIVGIDPSLTGTGVARIRPHDTIPVTIDLITSAPVPNAKYEHTLQRIRRIAGDVVRAALVGYEEGDIMIVAIEGPAFAATTGQVHTRAGLWWMLMHLLDKLGLVVVIEPTKLKKYVTKRGNAPKDLVFASIIRNFPHVGIVDNNEADAVGLAAMVSRELGFPMEPSVQRVDPSALEGVDWPTVVIEQRRSRNG